MCCSFRVGVKKLKNTEMIQKSPLIFCHLIIHISLMTDHSRQICLPAIYQITIGGPLAARFHCRQCMMTIVHLVMKNCNFDSDSISEKEMIILILI